MWAAAGFVAVVGAVPVLLWVAGFGAVDQPDQCVVDHGALAVYAGGGLLFKKEFNPPLEPAEIQAHSYWSHRPLVIEDLDGDGNWEVLIARAHAQDSRLYCFDRHGGVRFTKQYGRRSCLVRARNLLRTWCLACS